MATRTSASLHESFCVYRKEIDQAGIKFEAAVVSKFEELESRIDTLEREVRRLSAGKPRPPTQPSAPRSARGEEKQGTQSRSSSTRPSASADARKLYGDIRPGDVTHEKVQLRYVEFFGKMRRQFPSLLTKWRYPHHQHLPCLLIQLAYDCCRDQLIDDLLNELLSSFFNDGGNKLVFGDPKLQDLMRVLKMLAQSTSDFQQLQSSLHNPAEAKSKVTELLRSELMKLFKEPDEVDFVDEDDEEFQNRTGAFGILLNLTQERQPNTDTMHKQVLKMLCDKHKSLPQKYADVPGLLDECVALCWDMVKLNPPALVCQPTVFNEAWHEIRAATSLDGGTIQVYYRPVLFFSAKLDVAVKGEIGTIAIPATYTS